MNALQPESCFWSLLSKEDFKFLYIPASISKIKMASNGQTINDILLHRSLFEIMHPIEIDLARADLSRFLKLKVLAGSVTRCRLLSVENLAMYLSPQFSLTYQQTFEENIELMNWNIIDLVMYTVTESTVLAFFHNYDLGACFFNNNVVLKPNCDQHYQCFVQEDAVDLINILEQQKILEQKVSANSIDEEIHIFQVIDRLTKQPIIIWPQPQQISSIEMIISKTNHITLKEFKNSSFCAPHQLHGGSNVTDNISCSRHFYASSKVEIFDARPSNFQRILIPYGNIIFESLQISSAGPYLPLNYQSYSSPSVRPPYLVESTHRSKSIDDSEKHHEEISEVEKSHVLSYNYEPESTWPENREFKNRSKNDYHDDSLVGSSMFQKFRIQRYEEETTPESLSNIAALDKRRHIYKTTDGGLMPKNMKKCASCHTSNSPEWRRGPDGHKTLCNACGLRYSRFKSKQWVATTSKPSTKQ